ncbi:hypothetical protein GHT06_011550 [Daphnia sinensis]|uniref:Uncharacterized protein n=1 Tax=Daphnia sinensis TaxID=1820382 RepID=A0AAD5KU28_9CRUS|nr:hypothetical protein GHT06_011550 [Daphnia sinensis]
MSLSSLISLLSYYWWPQSSPGNNGKKTRLSAKQQYGSKGMSKQTSKYPENQERPDFAIINMPLNDETHPTPEICGDFIATGLETYPATPLPDILTTRDFCPNIRPQTILSTLVDYFNDPIPQSFSSQSCASLQPPDGHASPYMTHDQLQLLERRLSDSETHNAHVCQQLSEMKAEVREIRRAFKMSQCTLEKLVEKLHRNGAGHGKEAETEHCVKIDNYLTNFTPVQRMAAEKTTIAEGPQVGLMGYYHSRRNQQHLDSPETPAEENPCGKAKGNCKQPGQIDPFFQDAIKNGPHFWENMMSPHSPEPNRDNGQVEDSASSVHRPGQPAVTDQCTGIYEGKGIEISNSNPTVWAPSVGVLQSCPYYGDQQKWKQVITLDEVNIPSYLTPVSNVCDHPRPVHPCFPGNYQNIPAFYENIPAPQYPGPDSSHYPGLNSDSVQVEGERFLENWPGQHGMDSDNGIGQERDSGFANRNSLIFAPPVRELQSYPPRSYEEPSAQLKSPAVGNVNQYRETYEHGIWPSQSYPVNCQNALPSRENTTGSFEYLGPNRNSVQVQDTIPPTVWPDLSPLEQNNWSAMTLPNAGNLHPPQPANNAYVSYGWPRN